jgi:hypothetical protein
MNKEEIERCFETYSKEYEKVDGTYITESWIVEDPKKDKSALYGMEMPKGTWMVSMKIDNDEIYEKAVQKEIRGFSIEGYFADKYDLNQNKDE